MRTAMIANSGIRDVRMMPGRRTAFTLVEMLVVVGIIALLAVLAIPSLSTLTASPQDAAVRTLIRGLCVSAKARAAESQKYVGIRFQQDREGRTYAILLEEPLSRPPVIPNLKDNKPTQLVLDIRWNYKNPPPQNETEYYRRDPADRYVNFMNGCPVDYDDSAKMKATSSEVWPHLVNTAGDKVCSCNFLSLVAAKNSEPLALPKGVELAAGDLPLEANPDLVMQPNNRLRDLTTFTIVFSPNGQIVRERVHVGQRWYPVVREPGVPPAPRQIDSVFNIYAEQPDPADGQLKGLFLPDVGGGNIAAAEVSQTELFIYNSKSRQDAGAAPYTGYIKNSGTHIVFNVYTGGLIDLR